MKKRNKIILSVLIVVILASGTVVYKNRNTIDALIHSFSTTEEDTVQELEKNKEELQNFIDEDEDITVRDLTPDEAAALASGELSEEEVVKILTGQATAEEEKHSGGNSAGASENNTSGTPTNTGKAVEAPEQTTQPDEKEQKSTPSSEKKNDNASADVKPTATKSPNATKAPDAAQETSASSESSKAVSELIAKLYVQKSTYLGKLDAIEASVRSEFINNQDSWDSTQQAKKELLRKYLPQVSGWEKECDSTVYGIIDEIKAELQKSGKADTITETLKSSYVEEKKLKKTYFINRYMD